MCGRRCRHRCRRRRNDGGGGGIAVAAAAGRRLAETYRLPAIAPLLRVAIGRMISTAARSNAIPGSARARLVAVVCVAGVLRLLLLVHMLVMVLRVVRPVVLLVLGDVSRRRSAVRRLIVHVRIGESLGHAATARRIRVSAAAATAAAASTSSLARPTAAYVRIEEVRAGAVYGRVAPAE